MPRPLTTEEIALLSPEEKEALGAPADTRSPSRSEMRALDGSRMKDAGALDAIARGAAQGGTLGFADELGAGLQAGMLGALEVLPKGIAEAIGPDGYKQGQIDPLKQYELARRDNRTRDDLARSKHGAAFTAAEIASGLAVPGGTAAKGVKGAKLIRSLGKMAKTGAGVGGAYGLGASDADALSVEAAGDTAAGAVSGGVVGGVVGVAPALIAKATPVLKLLRRAARYQGRKAIQGGSDIAAASRKSLSDEAVDAALESGAIRPGSSTRAIYERLDKSTESLGAEYGRIIKELEDAGVRGPKAKELVDELFARYADEWPKASANKAVPNAYFDEAANIESVAMGNKRLGLSQAEGLKRSLQKQARFERASANPVEEARQEISTIVRRANEDAIEGAAATPGAPEWLKQRADQFRPLKQRLSKTIEARTAAERGAIKADGRQTLGLKDVGLGAATGSLPAAFATAVGSSVVRGRGSSVLASAAHGLEKVFQNPASTRAAKNAAIAHYLITRGAAPTTSTAETSDPR